MKCHFKNPIYEEPPCPNPGTHCISCSCSGPCVHEKNLLCQEHYAFCQGWDAAQVGLHTAMHGHDCDGCGCDYRDFATEHCITLVTLRA